MSSIIENKRINIVKAIGIIAVVIGHYNGSWREYFPPHLFHMPLFFHKNGLFYGSGMSWSNYSGDPIMIIFCTSILCFFVFSISYYMVNFTILVKVGSYSKAIMSYHLLVFLLLTLIFKDNSFLIVNPLKNYIFRYSDFVYIGLGVSVPMLLGTVIDSFIKKLKVIEDCIFNRFAIR